MPTRTLLPHPSTPCAVVHGIEVDVQAGNGLFLCYRIRVAPQALRLPERRAPQRRDGLWRHTCCELFVATAGGGYREFHFSPSGEWAAYTFDRYREGMRAHETDAPCCTLRTTPVMLVLEAKLSVQSLGARGDCALRLGLACVIEAGDGSHSYWALAHPCARPDFHHAAGFTLELETSAWA